MAMKNPPHPGTSVQINCLEPLGLSVSEGAKVLGVSRSALSRLIHGHAGISPEMAIRLSKAFGSTPGAWIRLQAAYDVAQASARADEIQVERYRPLPAPA
jgi:addiction module HigA family antidote